MSAVHLFAAIRDFSHNCLSTSLLVDSFGKNTHSVEEYFSCNISIKSVAKEVKSDIRRYTYVHFRLTI